MIRRGDIHWADLGPVEGSRPAKRRPVLILQSDPYNDSRLNSVLVAAITSNISLAAIPGNVFIPSAASGLHRDSVVNVTAVVTLNKSDLANRVGQLDTDLMRETDLGLRGVLGL